MALIDLQTLIIVGLAFAMGGILKGATGVGAPLIAVPVMTSFVDIRFAVAVFVVPNLVINLIQSIIYRRALTNRLFLCILCLSASLGAFVGSLILYRALGGVLEMVMAGLIMFYVGFRLYKPSWKLSMPMAHRFNMPMGFLAGFLQGAIGISAPASLTFLNAIKFERTEFIVIISVFFMTMSLIQLPTLYYLGLMQVEHLIFGLLSVVPLMGFMPVGAFLLRHATQDLFDNVILIILVGVAIRLLWAI